jgi:transposase
MYIIIPLLLAHIQELNKQILFLFKFIVKNIPLNLEKSKDDSLFSPKYNKLKVDKLPLIKVPEKKDYKQLLNQYLKEHDKPLKPIKSRGKNPVLMMFTALVVMLLTHISMTILVVVVNFYAKFVILILIVKIILIILLNFVSLIVVKP